MSANVIKLKTYPALDIGCIRTNVPPELAEMPVWLLWRSAPGSKRGDKPKKLPCYANGKPRTGTLDTPDDRAQLVTLRQVLATFNPGRDAGVGVALGPCSQHLLSGIDLDNCVRNGEIAPAAQAVIDAAGEAYVERSPSGTGVKIFGLGDIGTERTAALEIYSRGRFFAVTGDRIGNGAALTDLTPAAELARATLLAQQQKPRAKHEGPIRNGSRNNRLFSYICGLRARDIPKADAWDLAKRRNQDCQPPLGLRELRQAFESAWKYAPDFKLTDLGNAERLVAMHGDDLRYLKGAGWATWEQHHWDTTNGGAHVMQRMADVVRCLYADAARETDDARRKRLVDHARASESRARLEAAVAVACWQPSIIDKLEDFDANPLLLGLRNGVYDLRNDEFRPGRREDRITMQAGVSYDPEATCPRWEQFQREIHVGDSDLIDFKQRAWGYTISGETSEQKLFMPYGDGANGKTTELNVMQALMGDYSRKIEPETLLVRDRRGASNDIARLRGARFVPTVEVEDGGRLAESLVKQLTGRDRITARFMYQEHFEYRPLGKIWIATNHRPDIAGTDYAIWRRILLLPYDARFEKEACDPQVEDKLLAELPGILNWCLAGFRNWKRDGLAAPSAVLGATQAYRSDMDRIGAFLRECCRHGPDVRGRTRAPHLYRAYVGWIKANGMRPLSNRRFYDQLARDHQLHRVDGSAGVLQDVLNVVVIARDYEEIDA